MPNTPKGKKRKSVSKKGREAKPKRLKFDDEAKTSKSNASKTKRRGKKDGAGEKATAPVVDAGEGPSSFYTIENEESKFERLLDEHAERNNLTATNVKSILHRVITDKRVLEMVKQVVNEADAKNDSTNKEGENDFSPEFEPKLTRAKRKQTNQEDPIVKLTNSPVKAVLPQSTFHELYFPESSSDEEYEPDGNESEDTESYVSYQSDLASPFVPGSPDNTQADATKDTDETPVTTSPSVSRPLTRHRSHELIFKQPLPPAEGTPGKGDLIAKRTRSHVALPELTLEDTLLPDFMPDLYDTLHEDDMDPDDVEFQIWLQGIVNGDVDLTEEDNDEDVEYNFMAEDLKEEKEEYRNDRAVRITQKEVSELFEQLLSEFDLDNEEPSDGYRALLFEDQDPSEKGLLLTSAQRDQLDTQLWQHIQLLTQVHLMSREDPTLQEEASICKQYVNEIQGFSERATSAHLIMALGGGEVQTSAFSSPALTDAVRIVNEPFTVPKSPRKPRSPRKEPQADKRQKNKASMSATAELSNRNMEIMGSSNLFKFTNILPHFSLHPNEASKSKEPGTLRVKFTDAEDNLLAMGIKQFDRNWEVIQENLLPVKGPKQLHIRCKNLICKRAPMNSIKYLRETNTLWRMPNHISTRVLIEGRLRDMAVPQWFEEYQRKPKREPKQLRLQPIPLSSPLPTSYSTTPPNHHHPSNTTSTVTSATPPSTTSPGYKVHTSSPASLLTMNAPGSSTQPNLPTSLNPSVLSITPSPPKPTQTVSLGHHSPTLLPITPSPPKSTQTVSMTSCSVVVTNTRSRSSSSSPEEDKTTRVEESERACDVMIGGKKCGKKERRNEKGPMKMNDVEDLSETNQWAGMRRTRSQQRQSERADLRSHTVAFEEDDLDEDSVEVEEDSVSPAMGSTHDLSSSGSPREDDIKASSSTGTIMTHDAPDPTMPEGDIQPDAVGIGADATDDMEMADGSEVAVDEQEPEGVEGASVSPVASKGVEDDTTPTGSPTEDLNATTKANQNSTSGKGKGPRDKPAVSGRVTTRAQSTTGDGPSNNAKKTVSASQTTSRTYILEPDPEGMNRAQAFAEGYLDKVRTSLLKSDPDVYEEFLKTLVNSSTHGWSAVQLYKRMEMVLVDFPELTDDFVAFLEPEQAVEAGVGMSNLEFVRARTFLRKLEVHFRKTPSHFKKIMQVFTSWNTTNKMPHELHDKVVPMLRGQQHLLEEFNSFFDSMKPPPCRDEDFEEVEIGSGSEPEFDGFEEVIIPNKVKEKPPQVKPRPVTIPGKPAPARPRLARKPLTKDAPNTAGSSAKSRSRRMSRHDKKDLSDEDVTRDDLSRSDGEDEITKPTHDIEDENPGRLSSECREQTESHELSDNDPRSVRTEDSASDCALSVGAPSLHAETSNDSCKHEDLELADFTEPTRNKNIDRKSQNTENIMNTNNSQQSDDDTENFTADPTEGDTDGDDEDDVVTDGDVTTDVDDVRGYANEPGSRRLSARNLERAQDGRLVVLWTRDADRLILQTCHEQGPTQQTFRQLADKLHNRTPQQIEKRFEDLMNLFQANASSASRESANESSSSEDEEDGETGTSDTDTETRQ